MAAQDLDENFETIDADESGTLTLSEAQAVLPDITQEIFDAIDVDSDGELTLDEIAAALPTELCLLLDEVDAALDAFHTAFGVESSGDTDLAGEGLPDRYAIALVDHGACPGDDAALAAATESAYAANLDALAPLDDHVSMVAALALTSDAMSAALRDLLSDAGYDVTGLVFEVVELATKQVSNQPYSADGDIDGDDVTNETEFNNVRAAAGGVAEFLAAATDPASDGTVATPGCFGAGPGQGKANATSMLLMALASGLLMVRRRRIA